jgi:hypothetical protein
MKLSMMVVAGMLWPFFLFHRTELSFPIGFCALLNCHWMLQDTARWAIVAVLAVAGIGYVFERAMITSTFSLFLVSLVVGSLEESTGFRDENGLLTLVFFVQFLAYALHRVGKLHDLSSFRLHFSLQAVAAVYFLSGVSKLSEAGLDWFTTDAPYFTLEIWRKYGSVFSSTGNESLYAFGAQLATWLLSHELVLKLLLGVGLLLELSAWVMLVHQRAAFVYGGMLLAMHLGIFITLHIFYPSIMLPMLIFTINPLYRFQQGIAWAVKYIRPR